MAKIKQLSPIEAQKIAAGEVVERPANVVKELVENAIDAGATQITIALENGGADSITITDNGYGMSPEDAYLCIKQYATSKITCVDELSSVTTFGFRGEALASIASISHMTLITKTDDAEHGIQLDIEDGQVITESFVPCNVGTTIIIKDIFYNVPARKKFLKKRDTEWRQIQQMFTAFCFDYLTIHFTVEHDHRLMFNCPSSSTLTDRIAQLWEHSTANNMVAIQTQQSAITVSGAISNHQYFRYDRAHIFVFVNKRWVKNHALTKAMIKGYMNVIPTDRYPCGVLFIDIDPTQVDINIHPRKEEVQFLHPRIVEQLIQAGVKQALENNVSEKINKNVIFAPERTQPTFIEPTFNDPFPTFIGAKTINIPGAPRVMPQQFYQEPAQHVQQLPTHTQTQIITPHSNETVARMQPDYEPHYTLIGNYNKTYILIEQDDGLFMIDQHAAHERVLYEQFSERFDAVPTINLLFPQIVHLAPDEITQLMPHVELFARNGIILDVFGENQIIIQSTPIHCKNMAFDELVKNVIGWITDFQDLDAQQFSKAVHERMHAQMACTAAVKAGDSLSTEQMHQLIKDLHTTKNRFTCPHGRPTGWLLSVHEIEKRFKRNYQ